MSPSRICSASGSSFTFGKAARNSSHRAQWVTARRPSSSPAAATMKAGTLAIECSTVSYQHTLDMARELQSRGLIYIDCPVTGLPEAAAAGKLTLLVGADNADLDKARPFLTPIGSTIRHFGAVGTGTVFKLINNLIGAVQIASLAEGVAIAEQAGLNMQLVAEALGTGAIASPQVIRHSKRMIDRNFSGASFTAALRHKDAEYAVRLAETLLPGVPVSRAALTAYDKARAHAPDGDEGQMIEIVSRPK